MQISAEVVALLKEAGLPAMVVTTFPDLSRFMINQAEQLLSAGALCASAADRSELEGMARQWLAWAEALGRKH
jgi:hypothetical protein